MRPGRAGDCAGSRRSGGGSKGGVEILGLPSYGSQDPMDELEPALEDALA